MRRAGLLLGGSCLLFAAAAGCAPALAVALLLTAAAAVHVTGEMLHAAGSWGASFALAPEHLQGQYQGFFSTSYAASSALAPAVLTALVIGLGQPGWILLAVLFAALGALAVPLLRWAESQRQLSTATPTRSSPTSN